MRSPSSLGGQALALDQWRAWEANLPTTLTQQERHTATLILALERLQTTFPYPWGLTGGTCLQSYLPVNQRRYSSDLEIITTATGAEAAAWMESQSMDTAVVNANAIKCSITPDGTLFIIHSYPKADFAATDITTRTFEHYPLPKGVQPPSPVEARLISVPYLLATKLWEVQRIGRGGERPKDAYDLARCLHLSPIADVMQKLDVYAAHQKNAGRAREIARRAGVYLEWYSGQGYVGFVNWSKQFVPANSAPVDQESLAKAANRLGKESGLSTKPTEEEACEFLIRELTPKDLAPLAEKLGADKRMLRQYDNLREFVLLKIQGKLVAPVPRTAEDLLARLKEIVS